MPRISILFGLLQIALGIGAYLYAGTESADPSPTALSPVAVGVPLLVLGLLATRDNLRKHAMHGAAVVGVLGVLGAIIAILLPFVRGKGIGSPVAFGVKLAMGLLCLLFVGLCVNSFVQARRLRNRGANS